MTRSDRTSYKLTAASLVWLVTNGCASWSEPGSTSNPLPAPKIASDCVVLEVAFVEVSSDLVADREFWNALDELHVDSELRRRLMDNGLRTAVAGAQLPEQLRSALDESTDPLDFLQSGLPPEESELFSQRKRMQMRAGKTRRIPVMSQPRDKMIVLIQEDGDVRGESFEQAQGVISLRCFPQGDGRVQMDLGPEIEFGDFRQRWVGGQGSFVLDVDRQRKTFDPLEVSTLLSPGQTLLVTATPEAKGLGGQFFALASGERDRRSIMLLRLAQTQLDDLFCPDESLSPLTPMDD
jgi:hypothetical protein